jgi:hypothetical protein
VRTINKIATVLALSLAATAVNAKVSPEMASKLGGTLTPLGGEVAGNKDGSIPAWTGGITSVPAGYTKGDHHPDPFSADKPLYTITASNYKQYAEFLSAGQVKLFETYPETFQMPIYQTRRSASSPQRVYDATKKNAVSATLVQGGNGIKDAVIGVPFPIPENGLEAIWNHILRFRGENIARYAGQAAPTAKGDYTLIGFNDELMIKYSDVNATAEALEKENVLMKFKQKVTSPSRLAGTALLVHETMDQVRDPRQAWTYNTGQRRVRRAPNIAYDAPGTAADGLRTTDDFDMFNGAPDRYNWTLKGKKEMMIAYNSYKLHSDALSYDDVLSAGHINPAHTRYEKHRVWVVEANLKDEFRHVYQKRVFFLDEDSWQAQVVDMYDNRGDLYRVSMAYGLNYYEVPTQWSTLDVYHDLNSRRYLALGLDNETKMYDFSVEFNDGQFTSSALKRDSKR